MNPLLSLALFAAEQLIKHAPTLYADFAEIVSRKDITVEELRSKREAIAAETFEDHVPNSELPP